MTSVPGESTEDLLANPYKVGISLIIPTLNFESFLILYNSLITRCSRPDNVEMLLKIDNLDNIHEYYDLCKRTPFRYKILLYPSFNGRFSLHHFFNDLGAISSGDLIWTLNDDAEIVGGTDWYKPLMSTRNTFEDNIYYVAIPYDNGKGTKQIVPLPVITKEWLKLLGSVTEFPNYDRWLHEIAKAARSRLVLTEEEIVVTMPQGSRVLSKTDRKNIFYPRVEQMIEHVTRHVVREIKKE
tara:strand:+ start:680 stop:1399 length:720 start_codon:yes stop_codon:yes gene_type:complete